MRMVLGLVLAGCAGGPAGGAGARETGAVDGSAAPSASAAAQPSASVSTSARCVVVGSAAAVEGSLVGRSGGLFRLRLGRARCVVGLPRVGFITEVAVATAGPDLRPLDGARVRIQGDVIAGETDMGGGAVVVLAKEVERLPPATDEPYANALGELPYCTDLRTEEPSVTRWTAEAGTLTIELTADPDSNGEHPTYRATLVLETVHFTRPRAGKAIVVPHVVIEGVRVGWLPG